MCMGSWQYTLWMAEVISNSAGRSVREIEKGFQVYLCSYPIASLKREEYRRMRIIPAHVT